MMQRLGRVMFIGGAIVAIGSLLWMIWLPVFGRWHDVYLGLAVGWTACLVSGIGLYIKERD